MLAGGRRNILPRAYAGRRTDDGTIPVLKPDDPIHARQTTWQYCRFMVWCLRVIPTKSRQRDIAECLRSITIGFDFNQGLDDVIRQRIGMVVKGQTARVLLFLVGSWPCPEASPTRSACRRSWRLEPCLTMSISMICSCARWSADVSIPFRVFKRHCFL